jgi:serine/threonine protein kinase
VTDFGLATILESIVPTKETVYNDSKTDKNSRKLDSTRITQGIVGTPMYMAPEQWLKGEIGEHTDIYSFGCILQEMLSGEPAAKGDSADV